MSVKVTFDVHGLSELEDALKELRKEVSKNGTVKDGNLVKNALGYAARDVKGKMQFLAPESSSGSNIDWHKSSNGKWVHGGEHGQKAPPGRLKRSIFVKYERAPHSLSEVVYVGPRMGDSRNDPNGAWYAAIVEMLGGEGGRGKGFMRNSITPSFHANMISKRLGAGIERVAKKIGNENLQKIGAKYKNR